MLAYQSGLFQRREAITFFMTLAPELIKSKNFTPGREPCSSGYGRILTSKGCGFESRRRIRNGQYILSH